MSCYTSQLSDRLISSSLVCIHSYRTKGVRLEKYIQLHRECGDEHCAEESGIPSHEGAVVLLEL
jgi:hypothetical protein